MIINNTTIQILNMRIFYNLINKSKLYQIQIDSSNNLDQ